MRIGLFSLSSILHNQEHIDQSLKDFIPSIEKKLGRKVEEIELEALNQKEYLPIIFIKTGGVEGKFKSLFPKMKGPFLLLASSRHNSFAASLEIATFLRQKGERVEIIQGDSDYIARRIKEVEKFYQVKIKLDSTRLGVIGHPSDWLISSKVNYKMIKERLGVSLIDLNIEELFKEIKEEHHFIPAKLKLIKDQNFNPSSIQRALKIYAGLKSLIEKFSLSGITIRCFDLIENYQDTSCLGLALLNDEGIIAGCEGDIPALLSMVVLNYLTEQPVFMANPSSIDISQNMVTLAHCTLPLNMAEQFSLTTHFESGLGVGVRGIIKEGRGTIFKLSAKGEKYFISGGEIVENLNLPDLCRTQIKFRMDEKVDYFLKNALGNHHLICQGDYSNLITKFFFWSGTGMLRI
ncbi:MAG: fucose isomerase [Candidatus Caldatribacteriota bacterium]